MGAIAGEYITATLQYEGHVTGTLLQHRFHKMDTDALCYGTLRHRGAVLMAKRQRMVATDTALSPGWDTRPVGSVRAYFPEHYDPKSGAAETDYWFVEEYVNALDEGRAHECSGTAGRHIIEMMMGIFESAAYGTRVNLPQADRRHPLLRWREESGLEPPAEMPRAYGDWLTLESDRIR